MNFVLAAVLSGAVSAMQVAELGLGLPQIFQPIACSTMTVPLTPNRCRSCGASSYRRLVHRGADGAMRYSDTYRCSGCSLEFTKISSWRERRPRPRIGSTEVPVRDEQSTASVSSTGQGVHRR